MELIDASLLKLNETAIIANVQPYSSQGRLYELGFIKGATIKKTLVSFDKKMICFVLNNATFALRSTDAENIILTPSSIKNG